MADHITKAAMEQFCARSLAIPELRNIAEHLSECRQCLDLFRRVFRSRHQGVPLVFNLSPAVWLKDEHLEYEQLVAYVDKTCDETEREITDLHLQLCGKCREDVRSFLEFRKQLEPELSMRYTPDERISLRERFVFWWSGLGTWWKPVYTAAAMVVGIAGMIVMIGVLLKSHRRSEQQAQLSPPPGSSITSAREQVSTSGSPSLTMLDQNSVRPAENSSPQLPGTTDDSTRSIASPRRVLSPSDKRNLNQLTNDALVFNDPQGQVRLTKSGEVVGLGNVSPEIKQAVREVLLAREIAKPQDLNAIMGEAGSLRGSTASQSSFRLLSPERVVIVEDRPVFRWEPLKGATGYQVHVVNLRGQVVAQSERLSAQVTQWKPSAPIKRGVIYTWVVSATVGEEEITAPAATEPEMRFKVLEEEKAKELRRLQQSPSHLALGIFYARAGMIDEAERELQLLAENNPHSAVAQKLLRTVRSWR